MTRDHASQQENIGAYLLGALPELEARVFERHLMGCADCRDEVERLRVAAEALPQSVAPIGAPASLKRALMERIAAEPHPSAGETAQAGDQPATGERARGATGEWAAEAPIEREGPATPEWAGRATAAAARDRDPTSAGGSAGAERRGRWGERVRGVWPKVAVAAVGAVLLGGTLAAGYGLGRDDRPAPSAPARSPETLSATVDRSRLPDANGSLLVPPSSDEPAILRVQGLPAPRHHRIYEVWVRRGGEMIPATVFTVRSDGSAEAVITRNLADADAILVTREQEGGARAPSEVPVLAVRLG